MKLTFRLYRRGRRYYVQHNDTGQQESLETSDKQLATRLLHAKNEAAILVGMVLPGETALLVAGVFCQRGVLTLSVMIPVAIICAIAGDSVGFEFGRKYGPPLRRSRLGL